MRNPNNQTYTQGVISQGFDITALSNLIVKKFWELPDICADGGNDKDFFSLSFLGTKLFVARNEIDGLTVMLPEEY